MNETVVHVYLRFIYVPSLSTSRILYYSMATRVCVTEQVIEKGPFNRNNDVVD